MAQKISRRRDVRILVVVGVLLVLYVTGYCFVLSSHSAGFVEVREGHETNAVTFHSRNTWDRILYYVFLPAGLCHEVLTQMTTHDDTTCVTYTLE